MEFRVYWDISELFVYLFEILDVLYKFFKCRVGD